MGRSIAGVVIAWILWTMLWLGGNAAAQAAFPSIIDPEQPLTHGGVLVGFIVLSVIASVVAGAVCAAIARNSAMRAVWALAVIQLAVGIGVEISYWSLMPTWYHLVFLALLVPATVWGGRRWAERTVRRAG